MAEVMLLYYHCRRSMRVIFIKNTSHSYLYHVLFGVMLLWTSISWAKQDLDAASDLRQDALHQQRLLLEKHGVSQQVKWQKKCENMVASLALVKFKKCLVLAADHANAYSLAHGVVMLTEGLLHNINNDHQLAHVLAHEHAHLVLKHHQQAQQKVQNPPTFFTKSRLKKFYRQIETEADQAANETLIEHHLDPLQIHHYYLRIEQQTKERSADHEKLKNRIQRKNLPPEFKDQWWAAAKQH